MNPTLDITFNMNVSKKEKKNGKAIFRMEEWFQVSEFQLYLRVH